MAQALVAVMQENLISLVQNESATFVGITGLFERLLYKLRVVMSVLDDAEEKHLREQAIQIWLQRLKDALYDLDDILDECSIQSHQLRGLSSFKPKNIMFRLKVRSSLLKNISKLYEVVDERRNYALRERISVVERSKTSSIIGETQVYGRDVDQMKIVDFLCKQVYGSDFLSIFSIVGYGGLGKTTLAQLVFDDEKVSSHFNPKIGVRDSEDFCIKKILCSVIEFITKEKYDLYDLDVVERKAQVLLQNRRYLLVLDDVWSAENWNKLKDVLSCGSKGSCILVTTRVKNVVETMGARRSYHLTSLSEYDSWMLFKDYAFRPDKEAPTELEPIAKEIVQMCRGSPLATRALADLMRSKSTVHEWLDVMRSWIWKLTVDEDPILPTLRLSYFHLTPTAKQCFSFCAIFPKNTEIMKANLIHLWMANGFISSKVNLDVEDVGNIVWNELYQKSFFKDVKVDDYSRDISFKMHDFFHDLAQSVMKEECLILENVNMNELSRSTHHIGFGHGLISFSERVFQNVQCLRTLYQFQFAIYNTISGCFPTHRSLRVLSTSYLHLSSLGNLIHLRYLKLYGFEKETLPDSIYNLQKLEILKLISCPKLWCLPKHLTRLQNLRHFVISECYALSCMFPDIKKLSCLRTLSLFIVSLKSGHSLAELRDLNLGGKLCIEGLQNVGSLSEAQEARLMNKMNLHELCLSWDNNGKTKSNASDTEQVLEMLYPHQNLKVLQIYDYEGLYLPSWIGSLNNLVALELFDCNNCWQLPPLGKLPSLKKLEIYSMDNVQYLDDDESYDDGVKAFPSLVELEVRGLPKLERLLKVEAGEMFPVISNVTIDDCSKLHLPSLPSIKQLNLRGCSNELMRSISRFNGLTFLNLSGGEDLTSFSEVMVRSLTCLKTLIIYNFQKMKKLPHELFNLKALERLEIRWCSELESLVEHISESPHSLQFLEIVNCERLRSLPEGFQHLKLEVLKIEHCPELVKRCKRGTGEDWDKIEHIPKII